MGIQTGFSVSKPISRRKKSVNANAKKTQSVSVTVMTTPLPEYFRNYTSLLACFEKS